MLNMYGGTVSRNNNPEWIELDDDSISEDLGDISTLNTTDKSSAVATIKRNRNIYWS